MSSSHASVSSPSASPSSPHSTRFIILMTALIIVFAIAAGVANAIVVTQNDGRPYSPGSYEPDGTAALAELLEREGIDIIHAQTDQALSQADASSTVLLTTPSDLLYISDSDSADTTGGNSTESSEYGKAFDDLINSGATIIVLGQDSFLNGQAWGFDEDSWTSEYYDPAQPISSARSSETRCASNIPLVDDGGSSIAPVNQIMIRSGSDETCFNTPDGTAWARSRTYPQVYYFGASAILTNEYLAQQDNAGVALRMLSQKPKLLWVEGYVPDFSEYEASGKLPEWFTLAFIALLASGVWLAVWRWRRFGKLVAEPLPVIVPAQEANEGRARMYRSGGDAAHAARVVRSGFISRYASRLGLSSHSSPDIVIQAFADYLHADTKIISEALYTYPINTDSDLAHVVSALGTLEKEFTHVSTAV